MNLHPIDWAIIGAYLFFLGTITGGFIKKPRSDIADYLVAGRRLTLPSLVATTVSSWYGGILGVGEYAYKYGISMWIVFGIPYYLSAAIFALWIARRANQARLLTIPDQLRLSYGDQVARLGALQVFIKNVPAAYFLMLGILIHMITGLPLTWGVIIGAIISTIYVFIGGFRGDVRTDWLQFILMYAVFSLMLFFLIDQYGGWSWLKLRLPSTHTIWHGGNRPSYIVSWYFIALGALVEPTFYQRAYAARSPQLARKGFLLCIPFWFWFDLMTTSCGMYAQVILGPGLQGPDAFPRLGDHILPYGLKGLFLVGLIATIQSTADSNTLMAASALGYDLLGQNPQKREPLRLTRWGVIASTTLAIIIALWSESVVNIWHRLGSILTPSLILPLTFSYHPQLRFSPSGALLNLIVVPIAVGLSFLIRGSSLPTPFPFTMEPIFLGLGLSFLIFGADHLLRDRKLRAPSDNAEKISNQNGS